MSITAVAEDDAGTLVSEPAILTITKPPLQATSVSPSEIPVGSGDTVVTVTGVGFTPDTTAAAPVSEAKQRALATRFVSTTSLEVTLSADLLESPGTLPIVITDGEEESTVPVVILSETPLVSNLPQVLGVTNAASYTTTLSPGSFATIFGADLADGVLAADTLPLPFEMGGVSVTVNGIPAALHYVSPSQINFQVPGAVEAGAMARMVVTREGLPGETFEVDVVADAFGVFQYARVPGSLDPIIVHADNSLVTPDHPATQGETLVVYGTGVSLLDNMPGDGEAAPASPAATCQSTPVVTLVGPLSREPAETRYCGLTANLVSLVQINIRLPVNLPLGAAIKLEFDFGGAATERVTLYTPSAVAINEVLADPAAGAPGDANGDGSRDFAEDEFIEIVNLSTAAIDISGWTLSDDDEDPRFAFPAGTILRGGCAAVLFGGPTADRQLWFGLGFRRRWEHRYRSVERRRHDLPEGRRWSGD